MVTLLKYISKATKKFTSGISASETIELSESIKSIGKGAFANTSIETLIIPESVTSIGKISNLSIRKVILPESVKEIKGYLAQPFLFDTLIIRSTELVCNAEFYPISGCKIQNLYCTKFVYNANFEGSAVFEKVHLLD